MRDQRAPTTKPAVVAHKVGSYRRAVGAHPVRDLRAPTTKPAEVAHKVGSSRRAVGAHPVRDLSSPPRKPCPTRTSTTYSQTQSQYG